MNLLHRQNACIANSWMCVVAAFGFAICAAGPVRCDTAPAVSQKLTANYSLPLPWNEFDIGSVSPAGQATIADGVFTLAAGGQDIGGRSDNFTFIYQGITGDFTFTARVAKLTGSDPDAKAGIMARDFLATNTNFAASLATAEHGSEHVFRPYYSSDASSDGAQPGVPLWVKLINAGGQVSAFVAPDANGAPGGWVRIGSASPISTGIVYVGLVAASHSPNAPCAAVFDHVSFDFGPQPIFIDGLYTMSPASAPDLVLDGAGPALAGAPAAVIQTPSKAASQKWNFVNRGNGIYDIQFGPDHALALSVAGANYHDGDKIVLAPDKGAANQLWSVTVNTNGTFGLYSTGAPGSGIDDNAGNKTPGFPMDLWKSGPNDQHLQWMINPAQ